MENTARTHTVINKMLGHKNALRYLAVLINVTCNKDETVRRVLRILAASQQIPLSQKDLLRKQIRAWYKANVGDRLFFADSDLHRVKLRERMARKYGA